MISYQHEQLTPYLVDEMMPLLVNHKDEVSGWPEEELSPNWGVYYALQENGQLLITALRDDGNLVGYSFFIIENHIHYSKVKFAHQDVIYIDPDYRGVGKKLITFPEKKLKELGVKHINQHVKEAVDFSPLLKRIGYTFCEKIYTKRL